VLVDFKAAFDSVWREKVIERMVGLKVPTNIIRWIKSFLNERYIWAKFQNTSSSYKSINAGIPQGTVTSPILFNTLINSLPDSILIIDGIRIKLFAGDVIIWISGKSHQKLTRTMNLALARLKKWTEENGLTINASKTTHHFYTTAHQVPEIELCLGNDKIKYWCENPTYLGITLDRKLKGKSHISQTDGRGKRRLALMRRVARVKWGCTTETLANMYKMYVRPTLEYGMEVFPAAIPNERKQLDTVQNQALRIITGGVKKTLITAMEIYTGIEPLNARRESSNGATWKTGQTGPYLGDITWSKAEDPQNLHRKGERNQIRVWAWSARGTKKEQITIMPLSNTLIDVEYEIKIEGIEEYKNSYSEHELKAHTLRYIHSRYVPYKIMDTGLYRWVCNPRKRFSRGRNIL
jgi:hypothetical protein